MFSCQTLPKIQAVCNQGSYFVNVFNYLLYGQAMNVKLIHFFEDLLALKPKLAVNRIP